MQKKTKIIIASFVGAIIIIPVVIFLISIISLSLMRKSNVTTRYSSIQNTIRANENFADTVGLAAAETEHESVLTDGKLMFDNQTIITSAGETAAEVDQKIIKTGYLDLTVETIDEVATKISALASSKGGYTQSSSIYERENGTKYGALTIRVPAAEFEKSMVDIKNLAATVKTESATSQDVTEEYTDLEAQLRNAQAQEAEYLKILEKAVTVDDVLNVQSYLGQTRQQIEGLQGRIKYLSNLTSYSTITISISEEPTVKVPTKEFNPENAAKEAINALVAAGQALTITLIWLGILGGGIFLPVIIGLGLIIWLVKKIWHRVFQKK